MTSGLKILVLLMLPATAISGSTEPLGRLFFTPEQRAALDRQRLNHNGNGQQIATEGPVVINGLVRRSSGKDTVWLNGLPYEGGTYLPKGQQVGETGLPEGAVTIKSKPPR